MSYCSLPRLTFSGLFQADVSTVNNDVRHYDVSNFEPSYQLPQTVDALNGWWNPEGTGAFRLINVRVATAQTVLGTTEDPVVGLFVNAQADASSAKLVDLDPQFQMGSALFGLTLVLTDGQTEWMRGTYAWAAFRDIYFGRRAGGGGSGSASAKFTSVLTDLTWGAAADASPVLTALRAGANSNGGKLSVNLMTYGFSTGRTQGGLTGAIGLWEHGDPESFVSARRLVVANGGMATTAGIGFCDAEVRSSLLSLDLSNALPLQADNSLRNIGDLKAAILRTPDSVAATAATAGIPEGQTLPEAQLKLLSEINYRSANWLQDGGIVDLPLDAEAENLIANHPIALVVPQAGGNWLVAIRETIGGLLVRADQFEFRMDPPKTGVIQDRLRLRATRWGKPFQGVGIGLSMQPRQSGGGGGGNGPTDPTSPIPDVNFPADRVTFASSVLTGADGWAEVVLAASDPGNPRGYIDGQLYTIDYQIALTGVSPMAPLDSVVLHVRDAFEAPDQPDWHLDIAPFMRQYDNLYPIMSKWLFSLSDPGVVREHATLMSFAFERPLNDPNHMPATRDLSKGKRWAVLAWLAQLTGSAPVPQPAPLSAVAVQLSQPPRISAPLVPVPTEVLQQMLSQVGPEFDGKTNAMRDYLEQRLAARAAGQTP
jgi:hypothetical protein